ncbi:MAG: hypothetical protein ACW99Q_08475 [Candidatus Kariarchaeaceae archaeon]|jgi:protein-S-isoprenylcysteine O-methyltransferase Ste14
MLSQGFIATTLFSIGGIYGYIRATEAEEELLVTHFGDQYLEYQKNISKFVPLIY